MKEKILKIIEKSLNNNKNFIKEVYNESGISIHISNNEIHIGNNISNKIYDKNQLNCKQNIIISKEDVINFGLDPNKIF